MELPKNVLKLTTENSSEEFLKRGGRGQATIEYVLVLVVLVAIIGGMIWQFNSSFRKWGQFILGDYLECMLETGELPLLGQSSEGFQEQCGFPYEEFDPQSGSALSGVVGGSGSGDGGTGPSGNRPGGNSNPSPGGGHGRRSASSSEGRGGRSGGTDGASSGANAARGAGRTGGRPLTFGAGRGSGAHAGGGDEEGREKARYTGSTGDSLANFRKSRSNNLVPVERRDKINNGFLLEKEKDKKKKISAKTVEKKKGGNLQARKEPIPIAAMTKKVASEEPEVGWTMGVWFRLLFILAIIIALFFLIGGQMLQISKNSE